MIENIKKTKGFIQTPQEVAFLLYKYLGLTPNDNLLDLCAGRGALLHSHTICNCYGFELDEANYSILQMNNYINIKQGDLFELENEIKDNSMDGLILNPPYGTLANKKNSVDIMNIGLAKLKPKGRFAIINHINFMEKFKNTFEYFKQNANIQMACYFDTNLFLPFATVKTLAILGEKGVKQKENIDIWIFTNDEIQVNKRAKIVNAKLLKPQEKTISQEEFFRGVNNILYDKEYNIPTLEDFKNTITSFMAYESGLPEDLIKNPEKLHKAFCYFQSKIKELKDINKDKAKVKAKKQEKNLFDFMGV